MPVGPCEWPIQFPLRGDATADCKAFDVADAATRQAAEASATAMLWNWTGRVYGRCPTTVRPCRDDCDKTTTYRGRTGVPVARQGQAAWSPVLIDGQFFNLGCGCRSKCKCDGAFTLRLPGPVDEVTEVRIDGQVIDPSSYRVDGRGLLTRQDGEEWPECQDLDAPAGDPDTFEIDYLRGLPVPEHGQIAAGVLACELAAAALNLDCRLPQRVQTVTREGITVGILDSFDDLDAGKTGIWIIDSWVASVTKRPQRSMVLDPSARGRMRQTT